MLIRYDLFYGRLGVAIIKSVIIITKMYAFFKDVFRKNTGFTRGTPFFLLRDNAAEEVFQVFKNYI